MSLEVVKAGFMALVQDYGRYGYQSIGVTNGGPMDEKAFLWANYLLDNEYGAPQLEISFGGFSATFTQDTMIAVCGADLGATLNSEPLTPWRTYAVSAGDTISFATPNAGLRAYLAVKGGFKVKQQLSSCSTVLREKLGGINKDGQKLVDGDCLGYDSFDHSVSKQVPEKFTPEYGQEVTLRFIPNTSLTSAGEDALHTFTSKPYEVTQNIDRMGYRLSGKAISTPLSGIISQGISMGAIQVPKDGQPIVLMRDRQTMGGYPLIGCVTYLDLSLLAQSMPGTQVSFTPIDINEAEAELLVHKNFFNIKQ